MSNSGIGWCPINKLWFAWKLVYGMPGTDPLLVKRYRATEKGARRILDNWI